VVTSRRVAPRVSVYLRPAEFEIPGPALERPALEPATA